MIVCSTKKNKRIHVSYISAWKNNKSRITIAQKLAGAIAGFIFSFFWLHRLHYHLWQASIVYSCLWNFNCFFYIFYTNCLKKVTYRQVAKKVSGLQRVSRKLQALNEFGWNNSFPLFEKDCKINIQHFEY